jgi:CHASE2 domain-containing sensor protein
LSKCQSESVLAGGSGDSYNQDNGDTRPWRWGLSAMALAWRLRSSSGAGLCIIQPFLHHLASYLAFFHLTFVRDLAYSSISMRVVILFVLLLFFLRALFA